jgi:hypothetical protein
MMAIDEAKNPVKGVSGPGKFSARTDLPPSSSYGEGVQTAAIASGAPIASASDVRGATNTELRAAGRRGTPAPVGQSSAGLYDPTQRPEEPITSGIDMGAGVGSDALIMRQPDDDNFRSTILAYMPVLSYISSLPNTSPETRAAIRQLRDQV